MFTRKINYRYNGGTTRQAIVKARQNLWRIGKIAKVTGYSVMGSEYVRFDGEYGSVRISGFCWGYNGEGPRGLREIFQLFGINVDPSSLYRGNNMTRKDWVLTQQWGVTSPAMSDGSQILQLV